MGKAQVDVRLRYNICVKAKHLLSNCTVSTGAVFDVSTPQPYKFGDVLKKQC